MFMCGFGCEIYAGVRLSMCEKEGKSVKIERNQGKYDACCTSLSTSLQFYN